MDTSTQNNILEIKDLCLSFKKDKKWNEILHNINLNIKKGEILGLVGESGSGKSVTSLAVMDLLDKKNSKITNGSIIFNGNKKAMIFQEPMTALNPVKKCGSQVDEMIRCNSQCSRQQAKQKTLQLFEEVLLPDVQRIYNSYPFELSGGQRQRVMIAMAISGNPDLLIADEPTTALDVTVQGSILNLISGLQKERNMSILFISHDLNIVKNFCHSICVIYKGNIIEQNSSENIFRNPQEIYTKSLLAALPPVDYKPKRLLTVNDFVNNNIDVEVYSEQEIQSLQEKIYSGNPILEVNNVYVNYYLKKNILNRKSKIFHAINDVSFQAYRGETLGLVGESGCGKTTLGKAITHLVNTDSGSISFEGKNLNTLSSKERFLIKKDIQIIFQDPYSSLNPRKTVGSAISEPMEVFNLYSNNKKRKEKVFELLDKVELGKNFYNRYPFELSGGQRQRIGIARSLALNPKLIICDESVSALDVSVQAQILNLLNDLKHEYGFTYIFISHDLHVVKYMSDRIIVMQKGKIVEQGYAEDIYSDPQEEYTKQLLSFL